MKKLLILIIFLLPALGFSQEIGNYLILNDIGAYKYRPKRTSEIYGNSGVLIPAGHFDWDHNDTTYETTYIHPLTILGVEVQVTQHAGSDSDKWLLHEVESSFRGREKAGWFGQGLHKSASIREINGNKIFDYGNVDYRWISNYIVVYIHYTDLAGTKPEPLEIVQAYLQKFPSTIAFTDIEAKSKAHSEQWIKDEMERRLWLCDKWFIALQQGKAEMKDVLQNTVNSMNVFLDYREKYYGIKAQDEKLTLQNALAQNNGTAIKNKLTEYKTWWNKNKGKTATIKG